MANTAFASSGNALTPRAYPTARVCIGQAPAANPSDGCPDGPVRHSARSGASRPRPMCQSALSSSVISLTLALASPKSIAVLSL